MLPTIVDNDLTNFLKHRFVVSCLFVHVLPLLLRTRCQVGFANGNPSGSRSDSFKKAFVEEWVFISDEPSDGQNTVEVPVTPRQFASLPWDPPKPQDKAYFWEPIEAPLPPLRPRPKCNFIHPRQLSPFPERLELPFSNDEILSVYEEFDSSGTDLFTSWAKMSEHDILVQWLIFRRLQQNFARRQKGNLIHLLTRTVPVNTLLPVRLCRGDSASTTGTLDPDGEKKMPSRNELQEGGISLPCTRRLTTLTTSISRIAST